MTHFNPKWIMGKTVVSVDMRKARADSARKTQTTDPVIFFHDGSSIVFLAQEAEDYYGIEIIYRPRKRAKRTKVAL